jgi:putative SOS response-associated peptidase YedK
MCSNYDAVTNAERLPLYFDVDVPAGIKSQIWPLYEAPIIRRHPNKDVGDEAVPAREAMAGRFGLIPHWAGELSFGRRTYNARSETVAEKPSFRDAWKHARHCIVPAEWIYEPDWRTGKAVPTRIQRKDGKPMGIAGLWGSNHKATGEEVFSFTMLTINADDHDLFKNFHKPQDEKRMVVILREDQYDDWLGAPVGLSPDFMRQYPARLLIDAADPERGSKTRTNPTPNN